VGGKSIAPGVSVAAFPAVVGTPHRGHRPRATRWAFDHLINGKPLEEPVAADFAWREGSDYPLR
jgi:hypothetical protein